MSYEPSFFAASAGLLEEWIALSRRYGLAPGPGGAGMTHDMGGGPSEIPKAYSSRFVGLWPQQQIPLHCDPPIRGTRYHIPIQTNTDCWCYHDGLWCQLELGQAYRMDPTKPHGAVNWGDTVRIHLMVDVA